MRASWALSPWDLRAAGRGAALACALSVLAVVVTASTDEGGVPLLERCARVLPILPVCSATATWLALAGTRRTSEVKALEALGRRPEASAGAAALGAALIGVAVSLVMAMSPRVNVSGFFPTLHANGPYTFDAGVFTNQSAGWSVSADGSVLVSATTSAASFARTGLAYARGSAALVVGLGSVAFALTAALGRVRLREAGLVLFGTTVLSVVAFQAAAAGRVPALVTPVPTTMLLAAVAWSILRSPRPSAAKGSTWQTERR
jgi:hypothetical protein